MPFCASGTPVRQDGQPTVIHIDTQFMGSIVSAFAPWVIPYLNYLPPIDLSVDDFCELGPPDEVDGLSLAGAVLGLFSKNPIDTALATRTLTQFVHYHLWFLLCKCSAGSTPAPAGVIAAPADLPAINPPAVVNPGSSAACQIIDLGVHGGTGAFAYFPDTIYRLPAGATSIRGTFSVVDAATGKTYGAGLSFYQVNSAGTFVANGLSISQPSAQPQPSTATYTITGAETGYWKAGLSGTAYPTSPAAAWTARGVFEIFCGTTPGLPAAYPSCAPDPVMRGMLTQLLDLVTLIQRQHVPFAYVDSTVHSDLEDGDVVTVQGLIGVRVQITTLPDSLGRKDGTPDVIFDAGWISFGDDSGYQRSERVDQVSELFFPEAMGSMTLVGLTLSEGTVVRVTELVREP